MAHVLGQNIVSLNPMILDMFCTQTLVNVCSVCLIHDGFDFAIAYLYCHALRYCTLSQTHHSGDAILHRPTAKSGPRGTPPLDAQSGGQHEWICELAIHLPT